MSIPTIIFGVVLGGFILVVAVAMWDEWTIRNGEDEDHD